MRKSIILTITSKHTLDWFIIGKFHEHTQTDILFSNMFS